ncbi:MAG: ChbG/HpnK family deacetylase, partial [Dehalococcoidia bacterium]|nr:ChbG/HpnK family deacetylase [Dehalococcoidia bacterium]
MKVLIVNADDLGLSPGVNAGIVKAHRSGIVTSASLMANLPGAAPAVALARENPGLGIGLHLNLTAGRPLTGCPTLLGARGSFLPLSRLLLRLAVLPRARREARAEMGAQAERLWSLGVWPDHLDSHHHIHLCRPLRRCASSLAAELGVPMRLPAERLSATEWVGDLEAGLASFVAWRLRRSPGYPRTADHTLGLRLHRSGFDART